MTSRTDRRAINVVLHGLKNFCVKLPPFLQSDGWDIRHPGIEGVGAWAALLRDLWQADLVFTWAGRVTLGKFLRAARQLKKEKLVMFWAGSDVLLGQRQYAAGKTHPWVASKVHWAGAPWLAEEVRAFGLDCEYVPLTWVHAPQGDLALPEEFSVLVYLPSIERIHLYGIDQVIEVASALPEISFTLVGLRDGRLADAPPNVEQAHWVTDMASAYRRATVVWRPARHDGLSFMALEALGYGRHVIWSYPFGNCIHATTGEKAKAELKRLHAMHRAKTLALNQQGVDLIARDFSPERVKRNILQRWVEVVHPPHSRTRGREGARDTEAIQTFCS